VAVTGGRSVSFGQSELTRRALTCCPARVDWFESNDDANSIELGSPVSQRRDEARDAPSKRCWQS